MKRRKQSNPTENLPVTPPSSLGGWACLSVLALIALAACAAYCNSLGGDFIFDDRPWTIDNPAIRRLWPIWPVLFPPDAANVGGRPILSLTLAVNYALGGMNVWGYHAVNLAIHILAAWTLFGVVRRTLILPVFRERFVSAATPLALSVALVWMIHPLQTESVSYVIQRTEALMGLFYLLTLYCVIRGATSGKSKTWYAAAIASCVLGMATKEVLVTAPVVVLLYDRTFLAGSFREAWRRRYGLYLAMAATWGMVVMLLISTGFYGGSTGFAVREFTGWTYLLTQPGVIAHYLRLTFWPAGLCLDYNWPVAVGWSKIALPGLLVVGLLVATVWALVKRPAWGFLGAWFFVILAPTSSFVPIQDAAFEHRMYLSLAAVVAGAIIGGWLAGQWLIRRGTIRPALFRNVAGACVVLAIVVLGIVTLRRNVDYQTDVAMWQDIVAKVPGNDRARNNFGNALVSRKRIDEAIVQYEEALRITPNFCQAHVNLGNALADRGRMDEAIVHFRKATEIDPRLAEAQYLLGLALAERGRADEAIACFRKAVEIKPDHATAHYNLGLVLTRCKRIAEAVVHLQKAVELSPDMAEVHNDLGIALTGSGRADEAIVHFRKALELKPDFAAVYTNLGLILMSRGEREEAAADFRKALQIRPDDSGARRNLDLILSEQEKSRVISQPSPSHSAPP